ncbi:hypothetical protein N7G274_004924 [Stereocaulon virgatum]|uniref:Mannosyltransferase n=1 Tax=Stereocaulon virgatum TaxID=373712 RepID=A0ABR4A962_9LECA
MGARKRGVASITQSPREGKELSNSLPELQISSTTAFAIFAVVNLLAATSAPIQDCDEVFNYWEPTHYLNHGFGFETWEYSPEYAIRSWLYIVIHALPGKLGSFFLSTRRSEFFLIRGVLGCVCACCETCLFSAISRSISPRVAMNFLIIMATASGMFHASVAFLPSSFAMYTTMMGTAAFMDTEGGLKTNKGIMWFGLGATVGWPFAAALVMPFLLQEFVFVKMTGNISEMAHRIFDGGERTMIIVPFQIAVDTFFYHKLLFVPWNIVAYNVFSDSSGGPDIFGTEPWHFYIRNLLLNFNAWFLLALCAGPILLVPLVTQQHSILRAPLWRTMIYITPFYMWLAIFSAQAHKEERFMYPAYPLLCFNAAIAMHVVLFYLGRTNRVFHSVKIPAKVKLLIAIGGVLLAVMASLSRTMATVSAYGAPLEIYKPLQSLESSDTEGTVCLGKEWYRFPSSYFLPKKMRAGFIKSAFDGLLPGQFSETTTEFGLYPTWRVPPGMNDRNVEDLGKHVGIAQCSYLVDSHFDGSEPSILEPNYILDTKTWDEMRCQNFLDASKTHPLSRIFWIPDLNIIPAQYRRKWGRYCLLRRKSSTS